MEEKKTKKELIKEAQEFADKLEEKKEVIKTALDELDKKAADEGVSSEHASGMAIIEQFFVEYEEIELEQLKVIEQIKKK
jgi:ubiquinone biosynthesis protein COQ9